MHCVPKFTQETWLAILKVNEKAWKQAYLKKFVKVVPFRIFMKIAQNEAFWTLKFILQNLYGVRKWWNDEISFSFRMMKWWNDEIWNLSEWWNDGMMKFHYLSEWWNDEMMKFRAFQNDEMMKWWNFRPFRMMKWWNFKEE